MIRKYFTTTFRHLWRHRLFTSLNIMGLAISFSACWIIYRIVAYEYSYEQGLPDKNKIYRLVSGFVFDDKESYNGGVSKPIYQGIREQMTDFEYVVPVFGQYLKSIEVNTSQGKPLIFEDNLDDVVATDSTYFSMLPYRWLAGNKSTALLAPESVVLTESKAKQYFQGKTPNEIINKTITYYSFSDTVQRTVTGIVEPNFSGPTEFTAQEFFPLPTKAFDMVQWTNTNGSDKLYLQLIKGANPDKLIKLIDTLAAQKARIFQQQKATSYKFKRWYELLPLSESHFSTHINEWKGNSTVRKANKKVLYSLMGIALFLLLLACVNYINMGVASVPRRAKEIGVRKTLGSTKAQLISQFLYETLIIAFLAGIFSYLLSELGLWILKDIIPPGITTYSNIWELTGFIIILAISVAILGGLYPAWLITNVKAINVFKNTSLRGKNSTGFSLQKVLIVFQFVIALIFISSAIIVGKQLHYLLKTDMGFNKDAVVLIDIPWKYTNDKKYENKQFVLLTGIKAITGVQNISLGTEPMTNNYSSSEYEYVKEGKEPIKREVFKKWVDTAYLNLYGMKLLAGRNLQASNSTNEFVINETAVKAFGFKSPREALGKFIGQSDEKFPIVGVVKDFHMQDFYTGIDPMAFESDKNNLNTFNIKLGHDPSQWQKTLKAIEKQWYQFYPPESFSYKFYDETIEQMYQQERHMAKLIDLTTIISIFISCLGLFGLAVLTASQRTKEIGIRKVLGASVSGIAQLLSKEYIVLVLIAIIISIPIAWWAMNEWLQKFAYRITIEWWMFLFAGIIAIAIALITVSSQAIKAATANPVKSLRTE
jgi:putative ABC transport system permease protein